MTFTFENAKKVAEHYKYLIGEPFDNRESKTIIDYILIAPDFGKEFNTFTNAWVESKNNQQALLRSGADLSKVIVIAVSYDDFGNILLYGEIDRFLERRNMERVYLNPEFLGNQNQ
jgi:hypothetical protein